MKTKFLFNLKRMLPVILMLALAILIVTITDHDFIENFFRSILLGNRDMLNVIFLLFFMVSIFKFFFPRLWSWTQEIYTHDQTDLINDDLTRPRHGKQQNDK